MTACSDGTARIWTSQNERYSEATEREAYESQISQYKVSRCVLSENAIVFRFYIVGTLSS